MITEISIAWVHASWLEISWVVITCIALLVNFLLLKFAYGNRHALEELQINGTRRYAADTQIIREIIRIVKQAALLFIGIRALFLPSFNPVRTWDYYAVVSCLMAVAVGMAAAAVIDYIRFRQIIEMIDDTEFVHHMKRNHVI